MRTYLSSLCIQILQETPLSAIQPQCLPKLTRHLPTTVIATPIATAATLPRQRNHVCRLPLHPKDNAPSMTTTQPMDTSCILYVFFSLFATNRLLCRGLPSYQVYIISDDCDVPELRRQVVTLGCQIVYIDEESPTFVYVSRILLFPVRLTKEPGSSHPPQLDTPWRMRFGLAISGSP
jgi:hypothetical protein